MEEWIKMSNYLVKQGNSYCIRIPSNIVKQLKAKQGDAIALKLHKLKIEWNRDSEEAMFRNCRKIKSLNKFSDSKIRLFSMLFFNLGMGNLKAQSGLKEGSKESVETASAMLKDHYAGIKKDWGEKVLEEYQYFQKQLSQ